MKLARQRAKRAPPASNAQFPLQCAVSPTCPPKASTFTVQLGSGRASPAPMASIRCRTRQVSSQIVSRARLGTTAQTMRQIGLEKLSNVLLASSALKDCTTCRAVFMTVQQVSTAHWVPMHPFPAKLVNTVPQLDSLCPLPSAMEATIVTWSRRVGLRLETQLLTVLLQGVAQIAVVNSV